MLINFSTASSGFRNGLRENRWLQIIIVLFFILWGWTFFTTPEIDNWFLENFLVVIFLIFLAVTYKKFQFSDLSYTFIFIYLSMHIYGAKYTYALNPFGFWLQDVLHTSRNLYDRIVHFSFGFMLAYPMRDYFMNHFKWPAWVCWILPIEITLSFSCIYELIEWGVADVFFPAQGMDYLGTQGDVWDAQKDMFCAFCGAVLITIIMLVITRIIKKSK